VISRGSYKTDQKREKVKKQARIAKAYKTGDAEKWYRIKKASRIFL